MSQCQSQRQATFFRPPPCSDVLSLSRPHECTSVPLATARRCLPLMYPPGSSHSDCAKRLQSAWQSAHLFARPAMLEAWGLVKGLGLRFAISQFVAALSLSLSLHHASCTHPFIIWWQLFLSPTPAGPRRPCRHPSESPHQPSQQSISTRRQSRRSMLRLLHSLGLARMTDTRQAP